MVLAILTAVAIALAAAFLLMQRWLNRTAEPFESSGIAIDGANAWEIEKRGRIDSPAFFERLAGLLPEGTIVCLEGTRMANDVSAYLEKRPASEGIDIRLGAIWPCPKTFHMQATPENLRGMAALAAVHAEPEICDHLHAYSKGKVLVSWHDFPEARKLVLSKDLPETKVGEFCRALGCSYHEPEA